MVCNKCGTSTLRQGSGQASSEDVLKVYQFGYCKNCVLEVYSRLRFLIVNMDSIRTKGTSTSSVSEGVKNENVSFK